MCMHGVVITFVGSPLREQCVKGFWRCGRESFIRLGRMALFALALSLSTLRCCRKTQLSWLEKVYVHSGLKTIHTADPGDI